MSTNGLPDNSWRGLIPQEGVELLAALHTPWWIAGGWALDLYLEQKTRTHKDLDIGIFRRDAVTVTPALSGWDVFQAKDGVLCPLAVGEEPRADVNSLWCKRTDVAQWELELMLDESDGESWIFRRNPRITRTLSKAIRRNSAGIAYLAPEIQLLYKARAPRAQDQADFDHVAPHLDREARMWLRKSLVREDPKHHWISML